jgi:hypothetical protein
MVFSRPKSIRPLKKETKVCIYSYPSLPLVETLGLRTAGLEVPPALDPEGAIGDVLTPEDPFTVKSAVGIGLGEVLLQAADRLSWRPAPPPQVPHDTKPRGSAEDEAEGLLALYRRHCPTADIRQSGLQPLIRALMAFVGFPPPP